MENKELLEKTRVTLIVNVAYFDAMLKLRTYKDSSKLAEYKKMMEKSLTVISELNILLGLERKNFKITTEDAQKYGYSFDDLL